MLSVLLLVAASWGVDQATCTQLASKQTDNVIADYRPMNQGSAGLCASFATSLTLSALTKKSVSPLSVAASVEHWDRNRARQPGALNSVNVLGADMTSKRSHLNEVLTERSTGQQASNESGVVNNEAKTGFGLHHFSSRGMEGISFDALAAAVSAEQNLCDSSGAQFAGQTIDQWSENGRKNYTSYSAAGETTREDGNLSSMMGSLAFMYDANKRFRNDGHPFEREKLRKISSDAKYRCSSQIKDIMKAELYNLMKPLQLCPYTDERQYNQSAVAICSMGLFSTRPTVSEYIEQHPEYLNGTAMGNSLTEIAQNLKNDYLRKHYFTPEYLAEIQRNKAAGKIDVDAFYPEKLATTPLRQAGSFVLADSMNERKRLLQRAMSAYSLGFDGAAMDALADQIRNQVKDKVGSDVDLDIRTKEKIFKLVPPRERRLELYREAAKVGNDHGFSTLQGQIEQTLGELTQLSGAGIAEQAEDDIEHTRAVDYSKFPQGAGPKLAELQRLVRERREALRLITKDQVPETLAPNGVLNVGSTAAAQRFLDSKVNTPNFNKHDLYHQASDSLIRDQFIASEEYRAMKEAFKTTPQPSVDQLRALMTRATSKLNEINARFPNTRASNFPSTLHDYNAQRTGPMLQGINSFDKALEMFSALERATEASKALTPEDMYGNVDLDGDGSVDPGAYEGGVQSFLKDNPFYKALVGYKVTEARYQRKYGELLAGTSLDQNDKAKNEARLNLMSLNFKNGNDCIRKRIEEGLADIELPYDFRSCRGDLAYSLSSISELSDQSDRILDALDQTPDRFWDQVMSCKPNSNVPVPKLASTVSNLNPADGDANGDALAQALLGSVAQGVPMTLGLCMSGLKSGQCSGSGDGHAMAVVGYSARWNAAAGKCEIDYKLANSWGADCKEKQQVFTAPGVSCDPNNGIINVPSQVMNKSAKQTLVMKVAP